MVKVDGIDPFAAGVTVAGLMLHPGALLADEFTTQAIATGEEKFEFIELINNPKLPDIPAEGMVTTPGPAVMEKSSVPVPPSLTMTVVAPEVGDTL
jgi:hypothetical protein